jgi:hypothetical protein
MKAMTKKEPDKKKGRRKWLLAAAGGVVVLFLCGLAFLLFKEPSAGSVEGRFAGALAGTDGGFQDATVRANQVGPVHQFEFTATVSDGATAYVLRCDRVVGDNSSSVQVRAHRAADYDPAAPNRILGLTVDTNGDQVTRWSNGNTAKPAEEQFLKPKAVQMAHAVRKSLGW